MVETIEFGDEKEETKGWSNETMDCIVHNEFVRQVRGKWNRKKRFAKSEK